MRCIQSFHDSIMNEGFLIWEPLQVTLENKILDVDSFYTQISRVFRARIQTFQDFYEACRMRGEKEQDLIKAIAEYVPHKIRCELVFDSGLMLSDLSRLFLASVPDMNYTLKPLWVKSAKPTNSAVYMGEFCPADSYYWHNMINHTPATLLPRPMKRRIFAFVRMCMAFRVPRDLRIALVFFLRNLEVDYLICFWAIGGTKKEHLHANTEEILNYHTRRDAYSPAHRDRTAHIAALHAVREGLQSVESMLIPRILEKRDMARSAWVAWRRGDISYISLLVTADSYCTFLYQSPRWTRRYMHMLRWILMFNPSSFNPNTMNFEFYLEGIIWKSKESEWSRHLLQQEMQNSTHFKSYAHLLSK